MRGIALACLFLAAACVANAQGPDWVYGDGPFESGSVIAVHPDGDIFSIMGVNLYVSWDEGRNWHLRSSYGIRGMVVRPDGVMFGIDGNRDVVRSTNRGGTWEQVYSTVEDLDHIAVAHDGALCVASDFIVHCSQDGLIWETLPPIPAGNGFDAIHRLAIGTNNDVIAEQGYMNSVEWFDTLARFNRAQGKWVSAYHPEIKSVSGFILGLDGSLYVSALSFHGQLVNADGGFFRWDASIEEWQQLYGGPTTGGFVFEGGDPVIATPDSLVWEGPQSLTSPVSSVLQSTTGTLFVNTRTWCFVDYDVPLYCLEPSGAYRLDGEVWHQTGLIPAPVLSLEEDAEGQVYAGTDSGVFTVYEGGWSGTGWNYGNANAIATYGDSVYVAGSASDEVFSAGLVPLGRSTPIPVTNGCEFWNCNAHSVAATASNTLLVGLAPGGFGHGGGDFGIFRSVDGGQTWMDTLADVGEIRSMYDVGGDVVLAGVRSSAPGHPTPAPGTKGVYRSDDDGQTWTLSNSGLTNTEIRSLYSSGGLDYAGTEDGVFTSIGGGAWAEDGLPGDTVYAFVDAADGLLAGTSSGLFRRTATNTWEAYGTGLEDRPVFSLLVTEFEGEELIVAGTDAGVYFSRPGLITVGSGQPVQPVSTTRLHAPYPNPAHDLVTLRFDLDQASHVRIRAFDTLGREVAKPVDGQFQAGSHQTTWRVSGLASGVYLLRIEAGDMHSTQRLIVLR